MKWNRIIIIALVLLVSRVNGQQPTVLDGAYIKEHNKTKKVVPYTHLRQADVMWSKRIWRDVDLKQKMNHPLYYPLDEINDRKSLYMVIKGALNEGLITAYDAGAYGWDDEFNKPLTIQEVESKMFKFQDSVPTEDEFGNPVMKWQEDPLLPDDIVKYRLKEDWVYDKQRSERQVRIIGIAPVKLRFNTDGDIIGDEVMFWLYFPECRYIFANHDVFNPNNDSERRSFEDVFWKRQFDSYVIKENNSYNRTIDSYAKGLNSLMESERIKTELFNFEHDLWSY
ncbi:MAG: gliding motility associated protein GldN [Flavobacteriales bacterium]|jgi:gliding motility associated protien GldN